MSVDVSRLSANLLRNVRSGETVEMSTFWQDQSTAIIFFRRWGCLLCRLWAKEIGEIAPIFKKHNIRLVGVGFEDLGAKEFMDGNFFDGELYVLENPSTYNTLGFKRFNILSVLAALVWKESRAAISKAKKMGLEGNLKGDGLQNGGALFVEKGGNVLKHFVQVGPADHLPNEEMLKIFNLEKEYKPKEKTGTNESVLKWLWEPALSYKSITSDAAKSICTTWNYRYCRRLAMAQQQKSLRLHESPTAASKLPRSKIFTL